MTATHTTTTGTTDLADHPPAPLGHYQNQGRNPFLTVLIVLVSVFFALIALAFVAVIALRSGSGIENAIAAGETVSVSEPAVIAPPVTTLSVDGLGSFNFGDDAGAVIAGMQRSFGAPTTQQVRGDCPAGIATLVQFDGLTLHMTDEHLMGWVYSGSSPALSTPSGITIGSTLDTLNATYGGVSIFESSLGTEFYYEVPAGYIAGFLDAQTVTSLYAGETCFFR